MRNMNLLVAALAVQLAFPGISEAQSQEQSSRHATILHAGKLLTRWDLPIETDKSIVVADGRILTVSDGYVSSITLDGIVYSDETPVDLRSYFVLPGLVEGHTHVSYFRNSDARFDTDAKTAFASLRNLQSLYRKGFTTVRDMGSEIDIFELRKAIDEGLVDAPRLLSAGLRINTTGGPLDPVQARREDYQRFRLENVCDGPIDCTRATRYVIGRGADHVKIFASGATPESLTRPQFTAEELAAIISTADHLNRPVAAHAYGDEAVRAASAAGAKTIEHGWFIGRSTAERIREDDVVLVPTLTPLVQSWKAAAVMDPPKLAEQLLPLVNTQTSEANYFRYAVEAGVTIMYGSDVYGEAVAKDTKEPQHMAEWGGMSPREILESATVIPANVMGLESEIGQIQQGFSADIIAVGHDPTEQPIDLADVVFVMGNGSIFVGAESLVIH